MDNTAKFKRGIRWKLLMTMLGLIVVLSIVFWIFLTRTQKQYLEQDLAHRIAFMKEIVVERGMTQANDLARQVEDDIRRSILDHMDDLVEDAVFDDKRLAYVIIMNKAGQKVSFAQDRDKDAEIAGADEHRFAVTQSQSTHREFDSNGSRYIEFIAPLNVKGELWGVARLGYSLEMMNLEINRSIMEVEDQKQSMKNWSSIAILAVIVIGAIIIWIESGQFSNPLIQLTTSARELAKGNFDAASSIDVHSHDEIGVLANAFVEMTNNLKESYSKLEEYSHTLEAKVEERTKKLEKLMDNVSTMNSTLENIVDKMTEIGVALSAENDLNKLSELIVSHIRAITNADAGTLYLLKDRSLQFLIIQNDSLDIHMGGCSGDKIPFPPVALEESNVSAYVAMKGVTVNIPDVYDSELFDFTGPKKFDDTSGYRSKSMLVIPMKNEKKEIIGVIQLLNAKHPETDEVVAFSQDVVSLAESIASQAAVAVNNVTLMSERERLFEEVLNLKNYDESILECLSNGVISLDAQNNIVKCNSAALTILDKDEEDVTGTSASGCFEGNDWIMESINRVLATGKQDLVMDIELSKGGDEHCQINLTVVPLISIKNHHMGTLLILEDITSEKRLKGALARYMTKEVSERLMDADEDILGGQIQEAAVLFSDIRSFTTISETLGAQETVTLLNDYFTIMVDIIFNNKGILDKYIGDAIMAAFGIPFGSDDDTDKSVLTAIQMMSALNEFNAKRGAIGLDPIRMGIGINTDEVLAGNIGSLKRMDYTMIGDGVNLAARLEGATKFYQANILISENSYNKLHNRYRTREIDCIRVKGKVRPVVIYEVLDFHDESSFPNLNGCIETFQEGLALYRQQDWNGGTTKFKKVQDLNPNDTLPQLYINRCRFFTDNPPADDWDGVWIMETK